MMILMSMTIMMMEIAICMHFITRRIVLDAYLSRIVSLMRGRMVKSQTKKITYHVIMAIIRDSVHDLG